MIVILGLILLVAATIVGLAGVLGNVGSGHALTSGFSVFGYDVTGSTGTLFLYGIVVGAIGMLGRCAPHRPPGPCRAHRTQTVSPRDRNRQPGPRRSPPPARNRSSRPGGGRPAHRCTQWRRQTRPGHRSPSYRGPTSVADASRHRAWSSRNRFDVASPPRRRAIGAGDGPWALDPQETPGSRDDGPTEPPPPGWMSLTRTVVLSAAMRVLPRSVRAGFGGSGSRDPTPSRTAAFWAM
jgi:hypothetical protein